MFQNLTGWHALIILAIVVLVFGATKLPALARSVGQSMRILRSEAQTPEAARADAVEAAVAEDQSGHAHAAASAGAASDRPKLAAAE
ncbi:twin-arginine translocase TatA/TatE family subunit [Microbacterium sp. NPDC055903]